MFLKGHYVVLEKTFKYYGGNNNKVRNIYISHNLINKLSEEIKVPEHRVKLEGWQGPPHLNKVEQGETLLFFKISLLI